MSDVDVSTPRFESFYADTYGRLHAQAWLLCGSADRAHDLVQDAYARAYLHWHRIHGQQPYAYVRRIVVNRNHDWWRKGWWREDPRDHLDDQPAQSDLADHAGDLDAVTRALGDLTRRERSVIVLRYYDDATEQEIADLLGIAPGTVKSTANRALGKLRHSTHLTFDTHEETRHG